MNRQSLVAKMLHLQVASALVCILLYFALLFATRAGLSYYNNHSDIQQRSIARQVERFQKYVTAQEISAKDTRAIDDWVGQQSFLLMNIYRGHRMLYSNFSFSFGDGTDEEREPGSNFSQKTISNLLNRTHQLSTTLQNSCTWAGPSESWTR